MPHPVAFQLESLSYQNDTVDSVVRVFYGSPKPSVPDPDANEADQLAALKALIADKEASLFNTLDAQAVRDEVLLKCGFQLDVQLTPITEVTANQLFRAGDQQTPPREAIVCFDTHLDTTTLEWLCQQKGQRVIVLEAALDTTGKWNLHHQLGDGLVVF